ncbi:MAG: hypothetical protein JXR05_14825 [Flavobacteriaceae bacterium]
MRTILFIIFIFIAGISNAQDNYDFSEIEDGEYETASQLLDSTYTKNLEYSKERAFKEELDTKYSGKEFTYIDDLKEPKDKPIASETRKQTTTDWSGFSDFMSTVFPFILGIIVVLIVLKSFINVEPGFWNLKAAKKEQAKKLISHEEDIDEFDYEKLLQKAIRNHDYRLATRYYYLSLLKQLSQKKHIEYHKEKTNSEYLFEIKNKKMRSSFSYLSYVYSYVWYGEFPIDQMEFSTIEKKYKSFIETIK